MIGDRLPEMTVTSNASTPLDLEFPEFDGRPLPAPSMTNDQYLEFIKLNRQAAAANKRPMTLPSTRTRSQPVDEIFSLD